MSILTFVGLLILGLVSGYLSGLVGIGGGIIIVPALVLIFGFNQYHAQGTTIGLLILPIGLLAAINYYQRGYVDVRTAAIICLGFVLGGYLGSLKAINMPQDLLRKLFAVLLLLVGFRMFFYKGING